MFSFSKIHAFIFRKTGGTCSVSYGWSFNTEPSKTQEKVDYDEGGTKHSTKQAIDFRNELLFDGRLEDCNVSECTEMEDPEKLISRDDTSHDNLGLPSIVSVFCPSLNKIRVCIVHSTCSEPFILTRQNPLVGSFWMETSMPCKHKAKCH